mmetsp:Transcript_50915/g.99835  ORF Transcript_50915/g.99835 Transcript_50915/m.99835 type:complete len:86 (+) Transcript_50915:2741-2998(+)
MRHFCAYQLLLSGSGHVVPAVAYKAGTAPILTLPLFCVCVIGTGLIIKIPARPSNREAASSLVAASAAVLLCPRCGQGHERCHQL